MSTRTYRSADIRSLAMAEMTGLVAAVYRKYETTIALGFEDKSPAITSRFELFYDETLPTIEVSWFRDRRGKTNVFQEHQCMIRFTEQQ